MFTLFVVVQVDEAVEKALEPENSVFDFSQRTESYKSRFPKSDKSENSAKSQSDYTDSCLRSFRTRNCNQNIFISPIDRKIEFFHFSFLSFSRKIA